jgi:hypothetical protein
MFRGHGGALHYSLDNLQVLRGGRVYMLGVLVADQLQRPDQQMTFSM